MHRNDGDIFFALHSLSQYKMHKNLISDYMWGAHLWSAHLALKLWQREMAVISYWEIM